MPEQNIARCWFNGRLVNPAEPQISVYDHGLLYGDGVFEGIRFYHRRAFRLQAHLERLQHSARAIALAMPYATDALAAAVDEVIAASPLDDGYLRLVVTRGAGSLGIDPRSCAQGNAFIVADRIGFTSAAQRQAGLSVIVAAIRRLPTDGLDPRVKSLNYLNHVLARMEATRAGADEALLLNAQGRITEGSGDNVFVVRRGELLTPPGIDGALEGITRGVVLELAASLGLPAREASLAPYELYTADECFLTGTAAELLPVREIDGRALDICPGPVTQAIESAFSALIARECGEPAETAA
ncbi:branched-chain-amino-acid transaminase [Acidihalobacter yilgarnensis]|uniref:Branched-chain-amino-acid aminotransferase n=1 Tax=Acidihalobacter yilgarnensis TaxID=2819280 RepID=A0A1D8ISG1_9GAMM|nr:branched-chain-amino-acid transaminase [Acidihalobacter yilgarnensis]AOU99335.1 branched-chain-amino-acid transaminase [Acidihalobacter yilgarnensis]